MKKIAIVGGLGYVGSEITKRLEIGNEVTIVDCNIFNSKFVPIRGILDSSNLIDLKAGYFKEFDVIIFCCDIDIPSFYRSDYFKGYLSNYKNKIIEVCTNNHDKRIYWITMDYNSGINSRDTYLKSICDALSKLGLDNFIKVRCPEVYGPSERMRTDTFINNTIRDYLQYKQCLLKNLPNAGPLDMVKFIHVDELAKSIVNNILEKDYKYVDFSASVSQLSKIYLANIIQSIFGDECQLLIADDVKYNGIIDSVMHFDRFYELEQSIQNFIHAIQNHKYGYTFEEFADNNIVIRNAINSYSVVRKLI